MNRIVQSCIQILGQESKNIHGLLDNRQFWEIFVFRSGIHIFFILKCIWLEQHKNVYLSGLELHKFVPRPRVGFSSRFDLKLGIVCERIVGVCRMAYNRPGIGRRFKVQV